MDELKNNIFVVGAGVSGLTAAHEISKYLPTVVIDRLPLIGGIHSSYEDEFAKSLKWNCDESRAKFLLGNTALRWSADNELLIAGPEGIRWLPGRHLVYAGGIRPSTQAELHILGDRLGGVLPCTVAKHFLESGVRLGNQVVIIGTGNSVIHVAEQLSAQGSYISVIPMEDISSKPNFTDEWWPGWTPRSFHGKGRVKEIEVYKEGMKERILCDAVILAAKMRPLRNIDGAIFDQESHDVTFTQLVSDSASLEARSLYAKQVARQLLAEFGDTYNES